MSWKSLRCTKFKYMLIVVSVIKYSFLSCVSTFPIQKKHTCDTFFLFSLFIPTKWQKLELINKKLCDEKEFEE